MRLFLAINLPPWVREAVLERTTSLRRVAPGVRWVGDAQLHLTLKFLGERPETDVAPLAAAMEGVARRHADVTLALGGVGAFPNFRRARIVWLGVEAAPRLELLHHEVEEACVGLGYEVEGRPFRPHVTLGRVKERLDEQLLRQLARAARAVDFEEEIPVQSVDLMESELSSGGSRYRVLASAPLRGQ